MLDQTNLSIEERLFVVNNLDEIISILKPHLKPIQHGLEIDFENILNELNHRTYHTLVSIKILLESGDISEVSQSITILLRASTLDLINIVYIYSYYIDNENKKVNNDNYKYVAIKLYSKQHDKIQEDFRYEINLLDLLKEIGAIENEKYESEINSYNKSISQIDKNRQEITKMLRALDVKSDLNKEIKTNSKEQIKNLIYSKPLREYSNLYHFYTRFSKVDHFGAITKSIQLYNSKNIIYDILWTCIKFSEGVIYNLKMAEGENFDLTFSRLKIISQKLDKFGNSKLSESIQ